MSINFYTDADRIGSGEFVEGVVTLATQFTVPDGQIDYCRWPFPTVTPGTLPFMKVYNGAGTALATIAFDTTTLDVWNSATPASPIVVSAGTIKVAVVTPRYPARTGFFSGGSITRSGITAVQGLFASGNVNPTSTSTASYLADLGFTASGGGSAVTVIDLAGGMRYRSAIETPVFGLLVPDAVSGLWARSAIESVGVGVSALDPPGGVRARSAVESVVTGILVADVSSGLRIRSAAESVGSGVSATDAPSGMTVRSGTETVVTGTSATDAPGGMTIRSGTEPVVGSGLVVSDAPSGLMVRSPDGPGIVTGVTVPDVASGMRLGAPLAAVLIGLVVSDTPGALRARSASESVAIGQFVAVSVADLVSGLRLGAPDASVFIQQPSTELPVTPILAPVSRVRAGAPVSRTRIVVEVKEVRG